MSFFDLILNEIYLTFIYYIVFCLISDLANNEISGALDDLTGTFVGLHSLTQLNLDSNRIKSISRHAFDGLTSLKQLQLSNNDVTSVQDNAFASLKNLETM